MNEVVIVNVFELFAVELSVNEKVSVCPSVNRGGFAEGQFPPLVTHNSTVLNPPGAFTSDKAPVNTIGAVGLETVAVVIAGFVVWKPVATMP